MSTLLFGAEDFGLTSFAQLESPVSLCDSVN